MRQPINFSWTYAPHFKEEYSAHPIAEGQTVDIPHANIELPANYIDEKSCQFVSTYQKALTFDAEQIGKRIFVRFEGVAHQCRGYLNGTPVGEHRGGYTAFEWELHNARAGENLLTVVTDSSESLNMPPFGLVIDYLTFGGIYREVELLYRERNFVRDVYVRGENLLGSLRVVFDVRLEGESDGKVNFTLRREGEEIAFSEAMTGAGRCFTFDAPGLRLWDVDAPVLYDVEVAVEGLEPWRTRSGFRQAEFTAKGFFLNGRRLELVGLNRHQSFPHVGYAMPRSAQVRDVEIVRRELGCNMVRTSHYPQSRHFLDACDELGLLVMEELPGWQNIGDDAWKSVAFENIRDMIVTDRNHPAIVLWGVRINESLDDNEFYAETNRLAREIDPFRQTGGVRSVNMVKPNRAALLEDVYSYNDFNYWPGHPIREVEEVLPVPGTPCLITEHSGHTYPTKSFDHDRRKLTHALRHLDIMNKARSEERLSGAIGWCAFDYNTHIEFGAGDRICHHGVMDMYRMPKPAAHAYRSQDGSGFVLESSTGFAVGDYDGAIIPEAYIFTNCDHVDMYRGDEFVARLEPDRKRFPHLPHPPMAVDWFGEALERKEGFSPEKSARYKKLHAMYLRHEPGPYPAECAGVTVDDGVVEEIVALHNKYIQNWGARSVEYRFVGIVDGEPAGEIRRGGEYKNHLKVWADSDVLFHDETYDTVRLCCEYVNSNGARLSYAFDPIGIEVDDKLEVVGPAAVSLIGGVRAVWLRTRGGKTGKAKVVVRFQGEEHILELTVRSNRT